MGNVILLPRQSKTTMSSQGPDLAPNFSKMVLCISVRVQVGNMIGKYAPPARAMENQQCPARLQAMPPTFPNWPRLENVGSGYKPFKIKFCVVGSKNVKLVFSRFGTRSFNQCQSTCQPVPTSANQCQTTCQPVLVGTG